MKSKMLASLNISKKTAPKSDRVYGSKTNAPLCRIEEQKYFYHEKHR